MLALAPETAPISPVHIAPMRIPVGLADRTMVTCVGIQTLTAGKAWLSMDSRADLMGALKVEPAQRDPAISEVVRWPPRS